MFLRAVDWGFRSRSEPWNFFVPSFHACSWLASRMYRALLHVQKCLALGARLMALPEFVGPGFGMTQSFSCMHTSLYSDSLMTDVNIYCNRIRLLCLFRFSVQVLSVRYRHRFWRHNFGCRTKHGQLLEPTSNQAPNANRSSGVLHSRPQVLRASKLKVACGISIRHIQILTSTVKVYSGRKL